jgi:hypothetical protein
MRSGGTDWNERFQLLVEQNKATSTVEEAARHYEMSVGLRQLCVEFAQSAQLIGAQVIREKV